MENFEYSILLNDRDWAEFDLDSDECSLIPPALATAEDQVLSDLEEGDAEENRLIQVRVSPLLAHEAAKCHSRGAPDTRLPAEDIWSGREDETDLASVNSGVNSQAGAILSPPDCAREQQLPCATSEPSQSPGGQAGLDAEHEVAVAFNAMEGESDTGGRPLNPGCPSEVVAGSPFQDQDLQEQGLGYQSAKGPTPAGYVSLGATERMENPMEGKGEAHLLLELRLPKNETVSMEVLFPTSVESTAVSENAERSTYRPPEDLDVFQTVLVRKATPFQEKPSTLQEHLVLAGNVAALSYPPSESAPEKASHGIERALDLKDTEGDEGAKDVSSHIVQERGQADYGRCSARVKVGHPCLAGQEGNVHLNTTQGADSRCNKALDEHREMVVLAEIAETSCRREPCRHFEMAVPVDEETYPAITGGRRPESGEPSVLCGLTLGDSPESSFTDLTWPEMYDSFFCDDTKEEGGERRRDGCSDPPRMATELPDMHGPEMYEYFFDEMDIGKESHGVKASGTSLGLDRQSTLQGGLEDSSSKVAADTVHISTPEVYEHFFTEGAKDRRNWRGFLRRLTAAEAKKAARALKSFLSRPVRRLRSQPTSHETLLRRRSQGILVLLSPRIVDERPEIGGTAVMQPEIPMAVQPVLTQRDMCLGFMAFASWAVKTSDLQAPDAWKIVLLANFGTLSAIRFFRRQVVTERWHDT